ncbi:MAG: sigma-54 dependent transcriptional regulator [Candidatus Muiribacteriota bacterium]
MKILVGDDDYSIRKAIEYDFKEKGIKDAFFAEDGSRVREIFDEYEPSIVVLDIKMPKIDGMQLLSYILSKAPETRVLMISAHGTIELAVEAMKIGAEDFIVKPFSLDELYSKIMKLSQSIKNNILPQKKVETELSGVSENFIKLKLMLDKVSKVDSVVLLSGKSGTGKEVAARYIHKNSRRNNSAFIAVNSAVLSKELLSSELFGHVKGAFTGAHEDRTGKFKEAHNGTIFLDEIGELDLELQAKLLRVLQESEIEILGKSKPEKVDVRVIVATNRSLEEMVKNGTFREDLFYRLNVIKIDMPELINRKEDIMVFAENFGKDISKSIGVNFNGFSKSAQQELLNYSWPGNIRELKNAVERALVMTENDVLEREDFLFLENKSNVSQIKEDVFEENEKKLILEFMEKSRNKTELAKKLGVKRTTLLYKLKKYGIDY